MGLEIGDNGKLINWSNLFDYSSPETLRASTYLPTPKNIYILNNSNKSDAFLYNITKYLEDISPYMNPVSEYDKVTKIKKMADFIIDMYDAIGNLNRVNLVYDTKYSTIAKQFIDDLIKHESTKISPLLEEAAYKNSISCKIGNIVLHLSNMNLAYSPITMVDLQQLAAESEKGALVASMSLMNPLTKYLMQVLNMTGKNVISVGATGEKVFFNLSYYYNEGIRSGNEKWIKNLQFHRLFNRILNRYNYSKGKGSLSLIIKTNLANVNFGNFEHIRKRFLIVSQIDDYLRKLFEITDADVENKTEKWVEYSTTFNRLLSNPDSEESILKFSEIHKLITRCSPVDLLISQLLSAATDNAKELILAKINCGDLLAKCHLYLLMLGFDIKDVVSFMISPCVSFINDISEANMMDSYINNMRIDDGIDIADGLIDTSKFILGSIYARDEYDNSREIPRINSVFTTLTNTSFNKFLIEYKLKLNPEFKKFKNLQEFIQAYIHARLDGNKLKTLNSFFKDSNKETNKQFNILSDYVEKIIYRLNKTINKYADKYYDPEEDFMYLDTLNENSEEFKIASLNIDNKIKESRELGFKEFREDLQEFKNVYELANETTTLGGVFLKLNLGLPSSKVDLQNKLRKIADTVSTREKRLSIYSDLFTLTESDKKNEMRTKKKFKRMTEGFLNLINNNMFVYSNPDILEDGTILVTSNYFFNILERATAFNVIGNFNIENWLYDKLLTKEDIVADNFYGLALNFDNIFEGKESVSYRELISDYYNLIKGTWNIFDMMDKIPQYKEIINLLKTEYIIDKHSSIKSNLVNRIYDEVYKESKFIDDTLNKEIINYVNDLLITSFFRENNKSFPIYNGMQYLDELYHTKIARSERYIDLNSAPGRASFKKAFESIISLLQTTGKYGDTVISDYLNNKFIQGLRVVYDKYEVPRLSMDLDLSRINSTPSSQKLFLEYLNGFYKLKDVYINNTSLSDWFILYNLFVNQNSYGSDKLTTIFKNLVANRNSILEKYFQFIAKLDYNEVTEEVLNDIEYNIDDLLIRIAPYISRSEELRSTKKYIKVSKPNGEIALKRYSPISKRYYEIPMFTVVSSELDTDAVSITDNQKSNYSLYQMIPMRTQDFNISLREGLMSENIDVLLNVLLEYSRKGLIEIYKENC